MEAPGQKEGPPRFQCPVEFSASAFAPGPPFSPEMLQDPSKQLLLIRAPANFSPESLDGQVVSLSAFQTVKAMQLDRMQKVYSVQPTPGDLGGFAHLLVPSGQEDQLTCAPPFSGSLSIWERYGDPSANQPLLPVADRPAPQIPEGLKQRFLPFGGQLMGPPPPPQQAVEKPPQKKKKKRQLQAVGDVGDPEEQLPLKPELWVGRGPEVPSGGSTVPVEDSQPSSILGSASQESLWSAEEEPSRKSKKKRKRRQKEEIVQEEEVLLNPGSINQLPELDPCLPGGEPEPHTGENGSSGMEGLVRRKHKKKRRREEEAAAKEAMTRVDVASVKEEVATEPWELGWAGDIPEGSLAVADEELGTGLPSRKSKKKKKKEKVKAEEEQDGGGLLLEPSSIKQELLGYDELEAPSGPGVELEESSGATAEVPRQKHKKKKKKLKKEETEEGLGFIKQELKTPQE
ncbi:DNA-directed RNA polymerase I subunit RPA34 [Elgaria multicarinata webbii]|uniref:DNA-directed RNA polymerase I subunit RPA34 n=1 Tax=Elgaria multicarinata webbii TaxID=159646 RepID=UPI002FCCD2D7